MAVAEATSRSSGGVEGILVERPRSMSGGSHGDRDTGASSAAETLEN